MDENTVFIFMVEEVGRQQAAGSFETSVPSMNLHGVTFQKTNLNDLNHLLSENVRISIFKALLLYGFLLTFSYGNIQRIHMHMGC